MKTSSFVGKVRSTRKRCDKEIRILFETTKCGRLAGHRGDCRETRTKLKPRE